MRNCRFQHPPMFDRIYIEHAVRQHALTRQILGRYPRATTIPCDHYGEVFNRKAQSFRLQKRQPALLLASKHSNHVPPIPAEYAIGARENYYFSHLLNCPYDCRYCFLQGKYQSAHYVLFVNYADFKTALQERIDSHSEAVHFFSGYDCDSLALAPVTGFVTEFLPFFADNPTALLELRTKSTQIRTLLQHDPLPNCVVAFSLAPQGIISAIEHKTPSLQKRLAAIQALQEAGWMTGLRFDPLIYTQDFQNMYATFFEQVFARIQPRYLHSVTLGTFRLPVGYYRKMARLYPEEKLFAAGLTASSDKMITYVQSVRQAMLGFCRDNIVSRIPAGLLFAAERLPEKSLNESPLSAIEGV